MAIASSFRSLASAASARDGREPLLEVLRILLIHLHQPLEIALIRVRFVDHQLPLFVGRCVRRLAIIDLDLLCGSLRLFLLHLQNRVLFHLLFDSLLQRQNRQLQDLHRLDHPRRQHLLLHHSEILTKR